MNAVGKQPGGRRSGRGRRGILSDEDRRLWDKVAESVLPLADRVAAPAAPVSAPARPPPRPPEADRLPAPPAPPSFSDMVDLDGFVTAGIGSRAEDAPIPAVHVPSRRAPSGAGLDRRTALRVKRGQIPIDARLDLHGMTRTAPIGPFGRSSSRRAPSGAGLDRRTALRVKRGQIPIDARLDLHGMTQDRAHRALRAFVVAQHGAGRRMLLVITGKGFDPDARDPEKARGILRRMVPQWLATPALAPLVLAVSEAQPRDGGGGALYVYLRRRRDAGGDA